MSQGKDRLWKLNQLMKNEHDKSACVSAHFDYHPQQWQHDVLTVALHCPRYFANSTRGSVVQGGIVAAILDDVTWMALQCELMKDSSEFSPESLYTPTVSIEIKTSYLKPTPLGPLLATGKVLQVGAVVAFVEGVLYAGEDATLTKPLACMSSTVRIFRKKSKS